MLRVIKIHQLTKKSVTNISSALPWAKDDPKRTIAYLSKYVAQPLPSNRLWSCGAQKNKR